MRLLYTGVLHLLFPPRCLPVAETKHAVQSARKMKQVDHMPASSDEESQCGSHAGTPSKMAHNPEENGEESTNYDQGGERAPPVISDAADIDGADAAETATEIEQNRLSSSGGASAPEVILHSGGGVLSESSVSSVPQSPKMRSPRSGRSSAGSVPAAAVPSPAVVAALEAAVSAHMKSPAVAGGRRSSSTGILADAAADSDGLVAAALMAEEGARVRGGGGVAAGDVGRGAAAGRRRNRCVWSVDTFTF